MKKDWKKCVEKYNGSVNVICRLSFNNWLSHPHPFNDMNHSNMVPIWNCGLAHSILVARTEEKSVTRRTVCLGFPFGSVRRIQAASKSVYETHLDMARNCLKFAFPNVLQNREEQDKLPWDSDQKQEKTPWFAGSDRSYENCVSYALCVLARTLYITNERSKTYRLPCPRSFFLNDKATAGWTTVLLGSKDESLLHIIASIHIPVTQSSHCLCCFEVGIYHTYSMTRLYQFHPQSISANGNDWADFPLFFVGKIRRADYVIFIVSRVSAVYVASRVTIIHTIRWVIHHYAYIFLSLILSKHSPSILCGDSGFHSSFFIRASISIWNAARTSNSYIGAEGAREE